MEEPWDSTPKQASVNLRKMVCPESRGREESPTLQPAEGQGGWGWGEGGSRPSPELQQQAQTNTASPWPVAYWVPGAVHIWPNPVPIVPTSQMSQPRHGAVLPPCPGSQQASTVTASLQRPLGKVSTGSRWDQGKKAQWLALKDRPMGPWTGIQSWIVQETAGLGVKTNTYISDLLWWATIHWRSPLTFCLHIFHLWWVYFVLDPVLSTLHLLTHLTFSKFLWSMYYCYPTLW